MNNGLCAPAHLLQKEDGVPLNDASIWGSGSGSKSLVIMTSGLSSSKVLQNASSPTVHSTEEVSDLLTAGCLSVM